jgi:hypothetical protein
MKCGMLLFIIFGHVAAAQEIVLVDRDFKRPVSFTRQLTGSQLLSKRFPIYTTDLDSVIAIMEVLSEYLNTGKPHVTTTQVLPVGHSRIMVNTKSAGSGNSYDIFVTTRSEDLGAVMELVKNGAGNKKAMQQVQVFLDYLKNNRHLAAEQ